MGEVPLACQRRQEFEMPRIMEAYLDVNHIVSLQSMGRDAAARPYIAR